ncbi:MAG: flagellar type III secretion system pore protein FliP [Desulfovibrionaceae bacterium]
MTLKRLLLVLGLVLVPALALAQEPTLPKITMELAAGQAEPKEISVLLEVLFLLTVLSMAPAIVLTMTSFTRIIVVLHFLRQALGTQTMPPNQILVSLAMFLTFVIMMPTATRVYDDALRPYLDEKMTFSEALDKGQQPIREFLFKHTREKDLSIFYSITKTERPKNRDEVSTLLLVAAFTISELKTGFTIGFLIYIPFLILDMVVASILLSMGMMMLPPVMISLPFKVLLFILVDGWNLIVGSLVNTFG